MRTVHIWYNSLCGCYSSIYISVMVAYIVVVVARITGIVLRMAVYSGMYY